MRKVIAAINTTLDGVCDHTAGIPDEEVHLMYLRDMSNKCYCIKSYNQIKETLEENENIRINRWN
jgi:hypothetical protein